MATIGQAKGALLEELLLYFLNRSGYRTVERRNGDPTLVASGAGNGICVRGRGEKHQIDSIADFLHTPPFSYPIRLLLEAKFLNKKAGIEVVKNAVGVIKDVSEFFTFNDLRTVHHGNEERADHELQVKRYHYQYAICSANGFSKNAQKYAFAQDIYLLDLEVGWLGLFVNRMKQLRATDFHENGTNGNIQVSLRDLRREFREFLEAGGTNDENYLLPYPEELNRGVYFGVLGNSLPVPMVPMVERVLDILRRAVEVPLEIRIFFEFLPGREGGRDKSKIEWRLQYEDNDIFMFQLPYDYFIYFLDQRFSNHRDALNLKENFMSRIDIPFEDNGVFKIARLELDREWIQRLRNSL